MKNILSYIGFNQVANTRLSRLDSLSIVSRQSVLAVIVVCLTIFSGSVWGAATTYNFSSIPTTGWATSGGSQTINSISWTYSSSTFIGVNASKIQVGSAKKPQTTNWTIHTAISNFGSGKKVTAVAITGYATENASYSSYDISVGGSSVKSGSFSTSSNTYTASSLNVTSGDIVITLCGNGTNNTKALYLSNIAVTYDDASSTCTLHHGSGGSTTTNMTQGSGTLPSGNAVTGWTFSHWSTSQQTTPSASTPGTRYNSGVTTPAQANLYAFYRNDCNNLYCTAPTTVYHIVNMGPAVSGGDADDYFYTTVGGNNSVFCNITSGTTVYLTGHIGTGHSFHEWHVTKTDDASTTVTVTNPTAYDGTAYFTMPSYNVDIDAEFCRSLNGEDITVAQVTTKTSTEIEWECEDAKYYEVAIKNPEGAYIYRQNDWVTALGTGITIDTLRPATTYRLQISAINACQETNSSKRSNTYDEYFTTPGHTVTYNTNGGGGTTPTDATEYGDGASVELLNKNNNTSKDDTFFAGWTDNSSGTGTIYKPGDTYTITSDVKFYAKWISCSSSNTPQNVTITNDNTTAVTITWDAVTDATKYVVEILGDALSEKHDFEITAPTVTKTITNSDASADDYIVMVTPYIDNIALCPSSIEMFTLSAGCPNYSFHYGSTRGTKSITDETIECFSRVGETNEYQVTGFTIPTTSDSYFVGYQEYWYDDGMGTGSCSPNKPGSSLNYFYYLPITHLQAGCEGKTGANLPHAYAGAYGTIRIYQNSCDANLYAGFKPQGYQMRYGTSGGSDWANIELTVDPSDETVWTSAIMDVDATMKEKKYYVNVWTGSTFSSSDEGAHINNWTNGDNKITSMRHKTNSGNNWADGVAAGSRGFFRTWANNCANNGYMHFVPTHRIIYHANYPVGDSPADTYSVDVSVEETNSSISLNSAPSAPTGYTFDGWYDAASGGNKKTGSQTISAGASEDPEYYAHWTINTHSVNYSAPSNGDYTISVAGGSATSETKDADYGQTVTLAATGDTGYEFTSWTVTGETSGDEITVSNNQFTMPDEDVTVTASFTAINYNVTYSAPSNGSYTIKVASGSASSATKTANYGQTITLAASASEGYQFSSWTIKNTSTSADVTGSVSLSSSTTSPATFTMPAYGVTVIATFEARNYTLTWDWNGGETSSTTHTAAGSVAYGTTIAYPANGTMSKEGHTFTGWSSTPATMPASNTTITAQWSVNSYNVAVANVDHVAITATPASELAIGEGSNRDVNYGKSVTLAYLSLESKNYWGGWKVTNAGGDDVTASVVDGSTLTVPDYAVTVSAVTYGDLIAWCDPQVTVSDGFCLTSYYIDAAASATNCVYTTSAAGNLLTINSTDLGGVDKIEFSYLDGDDNAVTLTSSPFRLCYDGSSNYNVADPGTTATSWNNTSISGSSTCALSYSIRYKPTDYNLMDNYKLKMVFKKGSEVRKTIIREMNGRSLPEEFVIAAKFNGQWYALPNTLKGTQAEQGAITPIKITVDNTTTPTAATYAPTTTVYKGRAKYETSNPSSMALTSTGSNYLQTSNKVNQMWLSSSGYTGAVDWYFKSSDRSVYELAMDPVNTPTKKMGIDGGHMGYYGTPTVSAIYLLPITNKYTDIPATATEWGQYSVVLAANPGATATKAQARIEDGSPTEDQTITAINAAMGTAKNVKVPVGSINLADLASNEGKLLYIDWFAGSTPLGTSCVTIPRIIASSRDMYKTGETTKGPWNTEVHVLPGATLTANTASYSPSGATIKELHIYPGATLNVSTGTLTATTLRLRNGWTRAGSTQYNTARVYIADDAALTKTTASMDYDIYNSAEGRHYYPLAVPFSVAVNTIDYADTYLAGFSTYGTHYVIKEYNGANRAKNGEDSNNNWDVVSSGSSLTPGKGYIMTAVAVKGEAIIRVPLTFDNGWTSDGEKGTYDEVTKNVIAVTAHDGAAATGHPRHKGWNMLGVPFMSCYGAGEDMYADGTLINGELVVNTSADQNMEYDGDEIPYVSVPSHDFAEYIQTDITEAELRPGWSFFVQVNTTGNLTFAVSNQQADDGDNPIYAPKRATKAEEIVRTGIILSDETNSDKTTILVSDRYNGAEYEIGADLEKMFGDGYTLATYSLMNGTRLVYNAMSKAESQSVIPIGFRTPANGEYTFSLNPRYANAPFERVDLIDYQTGELTNLMTSAYTFTTERTQNDGRFALNVTPIKNTPTDIESTEYRVQSTDIQKVIIEDKLFIIRDGKMYDATGKRVCGK